MAAKGETIAALLLALLFGGGGAALVYFAARLVRFAMKGGM